MRGQRDVTTASLPSHRSSWCVIWGFHCCEIESELSRFTLQLTIGQSVTPSVFASSPSVTLDQILTEVRQLLGWCHGASSLTGGRVCLRYLTLYWSLHHLTLWSLLYSTLYWNLLYLTLPGVFITWPSGVSFARPSTGVFFIWPYLEYSLLDPVLASSNLNQSGSAVSVSRLCPLLSCPSSKQKCNHISRTPMGSPQWNRYISLTIHFNHEDGGSAVSETFVSNHQTTRWKQRLLCLPPWKSQITHQEFPSL